ncbi:MAG: hypothetical protein K2H43_00245 [Clostridia bacterium]|nr:hypothetical protein [Clostridia bacterium]
MSKKKKLTIAAGSALCALSACFALAACGGSGHTVKEIQARDATCTEAGNEHYYMCTDDGCGKIFSDAEGKHEIKLEDVVKPALGHDPQKVEAEGATCTTDGHIEYYDCSRCDVNFSDAAGTQVVSNDEIFIAKYDHDLIEEVKATAPTLEADGNVYHWHCDRCEKDFNNRTGDKEIEDVVIPKLVKETGLTINVTTYDNATAEGTAPTGTFALKGTEYPDSDTEGVSIANGKLSVTELIPDSYKFEIEGYYPVYFTVEKGVKEYNLDLYKYFHTHTVNNDSGRMSYDYLDGDLKIHYNNVGYDGNIATVHLKDDKISGTNYMAEFTVKYENLAAWTWKERFAIRLGTSSDNEKFIGVQLFSDGNEIHGNDFCAADPMMGEGADYGRAPFAIKGTQATAFDTALKGEGLQIRAMRSGNQLVVRVLLGGEWVKVWEKTVEGLETDFAIHASCPNSTFTVSDIRYFNYEGISQTHFGYFYEGSGDNKTIYSPFDANETTLDALKIKKQTVTVNVEVYDGMRNEIDVPEGLQLTLTDSYDRDTIENATITDGVLSATQFLPGRYNVSAIDGYYAVDSVYIDVDTTTYTLKLYQIDDRFEISNNDNRVNLSEAQSDVAFGFNHVDFNAYNPPVVTLKDDTISGANYMTEFVVKYQFDAGKGWSWTQRFGVRLGTTSENGKIIGFSFFAAGDAELHVSVLKSGDNGFGEEATQQPLAKNSDEVKAFIAALKGDGVTIRAIRNGDKLYLRAKVGDEWVLLYETQVAGLGTGIAISASSNDGVCVVSQVSFAENFVAETNEKYAHFVKDGKYYTVDGKETTLEGLDIVKLENLTINVNTYNGNDPTAAPTEAFTLYGEIAKFTETNVTLVDGKLSVTALYPGKYILILDGWNPECFTVEEGKTVYEFNWFKNEKADNVSVDGTTGDITMNNPWNGGVLTTLKDGITGENYMTEFTLKYQFEEGKNWEWTERFSIVLGMSPVDEKPIGFMFFMAGDNEIKGANSVSNDIRWFGDAHEGFAPFAKDSADVAAINTALKGDGLKVRGVRNGNKLTVYFLIGSEWKQAWTKTVEGLSSYIGVTAAHNNSTLNITGITFGEYVAATETVAAHLVVGEGTDAKVYTLDGVETTLTDLAIAE